MTDETPGEHADLNRPVDGPGTEKENPLSQPIPSPESPAAGFIATSRKAFVAGVTSAIPVAGTAIAAAFADGVVSQGDIFAVIGATIGAFALAFGGTYAVPNAPQK